MPGNSPIFTAFFRKSAGCRIHLKQHAVLTDGLILGVRVTRGNASHAAIRKMPGKRTLMRPLSSSPRGAVSGDETECAAMCIFSKLVDPALMGLADGSLLMPVFLLITGVIYGRYFTGSFRRYAR